MRTIEPGESEPRNERDERAPSQVTDDLWICAYRQHNVYPRQVGGKWLLHARHEHIDNLWRILALATEEGYLGSFSKVSTATLPFTAETGIHVACIYTYNSEDHKDIMCVRAALSELGIMHKLSYEIWINREPVTLYNA